MKGYNYSQDNLYFVTTCVHDRVCCFGSVGTGRDLSTKMILNDFGQIAEKQWHWLAEQYPYVVLHAFVVMPNHVHGIIEIKRTDVGTDRDLSTNENHDSLSMGTGHDLSLPKIKSLSELMGAYKTTVSKQIHLLGYPGFAWQRSFHDHIIRDDQSYNNISEYILNNPQKWEEDKFFNL
jgi:REP element-mobilizing transposase RayT